MVTDNVFRGSDVDGTIRGLFDEFMPPSPGECGVAVSGVEDGFEAGGDVYDIEVPSAVSGDFGSDEVGGRTIIFSVWKDGGEGRNFLGHNQDRDIHIQR